MKIAILSTFYPLRGGIAQFNACLYRELEKEHEVKAFTFSRQYPDFLFPGETQYVTEKDNADAIQSFEVLDSINPFSYLKTAKEINKFKPDLLIMKFWMPFLGPALGTVAKFVNKNTKIITILDNVIPHERKVIDKPFTKYFLKQNNGFVSMSKSVDNDLRKWHTENPKSIIADHPIYDHFGSIRDQKETQEKLKLSSDKKTLLFFGFIRDYKGLDLLIDAFKQLDDSYQLVIAGESYGSFEKYQKTIDNHPNKENIHVFNQYIGDDEVPDYFSCADVCVLPYKSATQSGITSIALHFELPIIATDVGGLKESIHDGETGLIVDRVDANLLASKIKEYFTNNKKSLFSENLKKEKEAKSWANFSKKIIEFSKTL